MNLRKLFKDTTNNFRIVDFILVRGHIDTAEYHELGICCHTARVTEIRHILRLHDYDIVAHRIQGSRSYRYVIRKWGEG